MPKLTNEQVKDMMDQLSEHFGEPVMPLKAFCFTMRQWATCIEQGVRDRKAENDGLGRGGNQHQHGQEYVAHIGHILTDIAKSALLGRLFYGGEKLRTIRCSVHNGHWSGLEWQDPSTGQGNTCPHGCGLTGWLPEKSDGEDTNR